MSKKFMDTIPKKEAFNPSFPPDDVFERMMRGGDLPGKKDWCSLAKSAFKDLYK